MEGSPVRKFFNDLKNNLCKTVLNKNCNKGKMDAFEGAINDIETAITQRQNLTPNGLVVFRFVDDSNDDAFKSWAETNEGNPDSAGKWYARPLTEQTRLADGTVITYQDLLTMVACTHMFKQIKVAELQSGKAYSPCISTTFDPKSLIVQTFTGGGGDSGLKKIIYEAPKIAIMYVEPPTNIFFPYLYMTQTGKNGDDFCFDVSNKYKNGLKYTSEIIGQYALRMSNNAGNPVPEKEVAVCRTAAYDNSLQNFVVRMVDNPLQKEEESMKFLSYGHRLLRGNSDDQHILSAHIDGIDAHQVPDLVGSESSNAVEIQ